MNCEDCEYNGIGKMRYEHRLEAHCEKEYGVITAICIPFIGTIYTEWESCDGFSHIKTCHSCAHNLYTHYVKKNTYADCESSTMIVGKICTCHEKCKNLDHWEVKNDVCPEFKRRKQKAKRKSVFKHIVYSDTYFT